MRGRWGGRKVFRAAARHRTALSVVGVALLLAATAGLVRWGITVEHAHRAFASRRLADERRRAGRLDEADELAAAAEALSPGAPETAGLRELLRTERREQLDDDIDRGDVVRAWRDWKKLRPATEPDRRLFDRRVALQPVRVVSELPGTRVTFHALKPDGHPKDGLPLFELDAGPSAIASAGLNQTREAELMLIPGTYWVTASVDDVGAFVERPFEVDRTLLASGQSHLLRLFPKTMAQASAGMVEITGGTLNMGSNETLAGDGLKRIARPEYPEHKVSVPGYYLDSKEVTNRAFWEFLEQTGRENWGAKNLAEFGRTPGSRAPRLAGDACGLFRGRRVRRLARMLLARRGAARMGGPRAVGSERCQSTRPRTYPPIIGPSFIPSALTHSTRPESLRRVSSVYLAMPAS